jgi:hypothetical protein
MEQNIVQINIFSELALAFIVELVIVIVSTILHPSRKDPANHPLVFMEYANTHSWIAIHIGQFVGGMMVFGSALGANTVRID